MINGRKFLHTVNASDTISSSAAYVHKAASCKDSRKDFMFFHTHRLFKDEIMLLKQLLININKRFRIETQKLQAKLFLVLAPVHSDLTKQLDLFAWVYHFNKYYSKLQPAPKVIFLHFFAVSV